MSRTRLAEALLQLQADLRSADADWALVGGLAVSAWAEPRMTRDIDVAVAVDDDRHAAAVVRALLHRGYRIETHLEQESADRLSTVRLLMPAPAEGILADLLFASSGIEPEVVAEAELLELLPGVVAPVARPGHLLALKVLALSPARPQERPQDFADIRELLRVAGAGEQERARGALQEIARRGFGRGKDLAAELEEQLRQFRRSSPAQPH